MSGLAIVTGASAGLGVGFAEALAKRGQPLLLVARRADRLEQLAQRLRAQVPVETLSVDLGEHDGAQAVIAHVRLNCIALMDLCHGVLPGMIAAKSGGILNIASTAAFQPGPWMAVYYATKAFVLSFSEALHEEVRGHGVRVSALCPGPVNTEFAGIAGMTDMAAFKQMASGPDAVVRDGLAALDANEAVKISGTLNAVLANTVRFPPRGLARRIAGGLQKARQG